MTGARDQTREYVEQARREMKQDEDAFVLRTWACLKVFGESCSFFVLTEVATYLDNLAKGRLANEAMADPDLEPFA